MTTYPRTNRVARPAEQCARPEWHREADDHRPSNPCRLTRIDFGDDGYVDFVDERVVHPDGQIVVVGVGKRAVERAGFFIKNAGATPQELFMALTPAHQAAPARLLEDHLQRSENDHGVAREPRALSTSTVFSDFTGPTLGRTTFYEVYTNTSDEDPRGCGYPSSFFNHWALYDTGAVEDFIDWPSGYAFIENVTQRALSLCYHPDDNGSGGVILVWIESGIDDSFYPTIWSATFTTDHFVWFKTGTYLSKGISHLHWSELEPFSGYVRLLGTWSDF